MGGFMDFFTGGGGDLIGSGISAAVSAKVAADNRRFQERMTRNRYQYQMADMQAAGLNPMLSFGQQPPGSPPGAMAQIPDFGKTSVASGLAAAQKALLGEQEEKEQSITDLNTATTARTQAETVLKQLEAERSGVWNRAWGWGTKAMDITDEYIPTGARRAKEQQKFQLDWDHYMKQFDVYKRAQQPTYMKKKIKPEGSW